jgi:tetratricopeptide (TPR) repeat protein
LPDSETAGDHGTRRVLLPFAVVMLLGLLVIFVLPGQVDRAKDAPATAPETGLVSPAAPVDDAQEARTRAEQALQAGLALRARLELENADAWGEPEWSRSAARTAQGDRLFAQHRFQPAADAYAEARDLLQSLADTREQRFMDAMAQGAKALAANDSDTAMGHFELALAIHPQDADAAQSLERARQRPEVLLALQAGEGAEAAGDPGAAREAYARAVAIDSGYEPATAALARVSGLLEDIGYREAMTRALVELDGGRFGAADRALQEAAGFRPGDVAIQDAKRRLAAARRQAHLEGLRGKAQARVRAEDWAGAIAVYRQALDVDANAGFATAGLAQAEARAELHAQIDHYVDQPSRLYSDEPLANATRLLDSAAAAPVDEPKLAGKIARLSRLVTDAATPQPVRLRSDGMTEVLIYHVGRLGRFENHKLSLRPGDYTVVGSRRGYRDVRMTLQVRPDRPVPVLTVRCEEPV